MRDLANVNLEDPVEAECFLVIVGQLCDMSLRVLTVSERKGLGDTLLDSELTFVTPWVEFLVPDIAAFLQSPDPSPVLD